MNDYFISSELTSRSKNIFGNRRVNFISDFIEKFEVEVSNLNSDFNIFSKINPPMLIGLNRRVSNKRVEHNPNVVDSFDGAEINFFEDNDSREFDSFDIALHDCKVMILNEFKRVKKYENAQVNVLKNSIITSSFTYVDDYTEIFTTQDKIESKFSEIKTRKGDILEVLNNVEIKDASLNSMSSSFFEKLEDLYDRAYSKSDDVDNKYTIEYLLNIAQVERIYNLVKIIDKHKSTLDEKKIKIDLFVDVVNSFFMQTDKKLIINSIGNVYISIKDSEHKVEIDELSSGEKQLVIIIANMVFSRKANLIAIIIDEPEISLHIKWQDMFISALKKINRDIQIILATHSPDIIGEYDDCCTPIQRWCK